MSTLTTPPKTRRITPEEFLALPDNDRYELVRGKLVELPMSLLSSYVAGEIHYRLVNHCKPARLGWLFPEGTAYRCFPFDRSLVRKPDTSFIRLDRLSTEMALQEGYVTIVPDLAVEVVSPSDTVQGLEEKIDDFKQAGVKLIWVVHPQHHIVRIHRADGTIQQLGETDELSGEDVIPGFRCPVRELFIGPNGQLLQPPPVKVED
jgi:Uma2 family endonuclease